MKLLKVLIDHKAEIFWSLEMFQILFKTKNWRFKCQNQTNSRHDAFFYETLVGHEFICEITSENISKMQFSLLYFR